MKFSFCLFFCSMLFGCTTQPADKNENSMLPEFNDQTLTIEINVNTAYPFGSAKLDSIKYPHHWDEDHENYGHLKSPEGKEFEDISTFLSGLHNAPTITGPKVDSIEYLNLNEQYKNDSYYFDTIAVKSLDSCLYRLPDFGKYECYYYRQYSKKMTYGVYGSLLLLDSATHIGKFYDSLLSAFRSSGGSCLPTCRASADIQVS